MGTLLPGRVFSSFGLQKAWLGDLETGSSLRTSWTSQTEFDNGQSLGFAVNSGRQKSPVLKQERGKSAKTNLLFSVQISQHASIFLQFFCNCLLRKSNCNPPHCISPCLITKHNNVLAVWRRSKTCVTSPMFYGRACFVLLFYYSMSNQLKPARVC